MTSNKKKLIACFLQNDRIEIPQEIETIGKDAFSGLSLVKRIILPNNLKYIGRAFNDCKALDKLEIPETSRHIEEGAFWGCENLKEISIKCKYRYIGVHSFSGVNPTKVNVTQDIEKYVKHFGKGVVQEMPSN